MLKSVLHITALLLMAIPQSSRAGNHQTDPAPLLFGTEAELVVGNEQEGLIFGDATDIAIGLDGRVYVLDGRFGRVQILSPEGDHLGDFGQAGEGPGDFTIPLCITVDPTTGNVWIGNLSGRMGQFTPDGIVVDDIRFTWPGDRAIRSMCIADDGSIYIACVNVLEQTMVHVFDQKGALLNSFGETFAAGYPDTDVYGEMSYAIGFIDLKGDVLIYSQKNPYEIRLYDLDGTLNKVIPASDQGVPFPPPFIQPDGTRVQRSLRGSWGIVALDDGGFINNIVIPMKIDSPAGSIIERYNQDGVRIQVEDHQSTLFVRALDEEGRVWAVDNDPYGRVMRYPAIGSSE